MHPPHKKNVFPPVANPIEQGYIVEKSIIKVAMVKKILYGKNKMN